MAEDASIWKSLRKKIQDLSKNIGKPNPGLVGNAVRTYRDYGKLLLKTPIQGNQLFRGSSRMYSTMYPKYVGRMTMFFYDPKWANELPYYDRFPLIIPIGEYKNPKTGQVDGFLGLNLHYLSPAQRAKLLDAITAIYDNQHIDEKKRLIFSWNLCQSYIRSRLHIPCIKHYLYSHLRSKMYLIHPEDWTMAILLPTERFEKANKTRVWTESMNKAKR